METEKILITSNAMDYDDTMEKIDLYLEDFDLAHKDNLHVRLIVEETLGMIKAMTGDFKALMWIEDDGDECSVNMTAKTIMNIDKKNDLLSVASNKANAYAHGFMGKIGDIIQNGVLNYNNVMKLQQEYGTGNVGFGSMGAYSGPDVVEDSGIVWSMSQYKDSLMAIKDSDDAASSAWDELEKSIVASIADDVIVGIKNDVVELSITRKLQNK